jgi:hypothetical protein
VLLVGGASGSGPAQEAAELYDPSQGTFALAAGPLAMGRERHTATLLANGRVLIAGGTLDGLTPLATAQVFDPASGTFADSGSLGTPRFGAGATLQRDGTVLVTGGTGAGPAALAGAELFDAQDGLVPALPVPALAAPATALFGSTAAASATVPAGGRCVWAIVNGTLTGGAGTPAITFTLGAGGSTRVRVLVLSGVGLAVAEERVVVGN